VTTVLLVGVGAVGARAARQLVETPGIDRLLIADARPARVGEVAEAMGAKAEIVDWQAGTPLPAGVDTVACAVPSGDDITIARDALDAAVPCVSASDDTLTIQGLLEVAAPYAPSYRLGRLRLTSTDVSSLVPCCLAQAGEWWDFVPAPR